MDWCKHDIGSLLTVLGLLEYWRKHENEAIIVPYGKRSLGKTPDQVAGFIRYAWCFASFHLINKVAQ